MTFKATPAIEWLENEFFERQLKLGPVARRYTIEVFYDVECICWPFEDHEQPDPSFFPYKYCIANVTNDDYDEEDSDELGYLISEAMQETTERLITLSEGSLLYQAIGK